MNLLKFSNKDVNDGVLAQLANLRLKYIEALSVIHPVTASQQVVVSVQDITPLITFASC